jgi:hypothetical protein
MEIDANEDHPLVEINDDINEEDVLNKIPTSIMCNIAMGKKNKRQEEHARKAMKKCSKAAMKSGVLPCAFVTLHLQVDYRTYYNPEGLVTIVYAVQPKSAVIKVCCKHGVITHDGRKGMYWVPADKYSIKASVGMYFPLPDKLVEVHKKVEDGIFD